MQKTGTALITGARTGIGKATAQLFAQKGWSVIAHMRAQDNEFDAFADELRTTYAVDVSCVYFDLCDTKTLKEEIKQLLRNKVQVDALVNNAGVALGGTFLMTGIRKTREVFETNLFAHMEITQLILRDMAKRRSGSIINVASISGVNFTKGNTTYGVSKATLIAWTKALALETSDFLVRVNAVAPGLTESKMSQQLTSQYTELLYGRAFDKRYAYPREVAEAIFFLASSEASYINGAVLSIDGGGGI